MSREREEHLSTADIAAAADAGQAQPGQTMPAPDAVRGDMRGDMHDGRDRPAMHDMRAPAQPASSMPPAGGSASHEQLAPLFDAKLTEDMRRHWAEIQGSFVDDPRRAVEQADELVAQALQDLARSFARHRQQIEAEAGAGGGQQPSTENLRIALRRYRSFFERLLSL